MSDLPIIDVLPELITRLQTCPQVILQAPPGAGKSTYLPLMLLKQQVFSGKILMLEPRRLAARNIALFMAEQLGERVGERVGYRMRGDTQISKSTRLEVVTEGILTRLMQQDPELTGYDLVIFDEFHERSLNADVGLAFALEIQAGLRDDLTLLIMSATLDGERLQSLLPEAAVVTSAGRSYPISYSYHTVNLQQPLHLAVAAVAKTALLQQQGSILIFLPGVAEIKRTQQALQCDLADRAGSEPVNVFPLYGQLTQQEQQAAIQPATEGQRKIVLATNIAETSLTIEGISVVIDSGLERRMRFTPKSGVSKLVTRRISQASATQRAGRAGRLQAGHCYRLWREEEHGRLEKQIEPEIKVADITATWLELKAWGVNEFQELTWLDLPPETHLQHANDLLQKLGAIETPSESQLSMPEFGARCTAHGRALATYGMSPRLAHMLLTAQQWEADMPGAAWLACRLIALLEGSERLPDDLALALQQMARGQYRQASRQAQQWAKRFGISTEENTADYAGLLLCQAYPDRIAQQRNNGDKYVLSNGIGVALPPGSALLSHRYLVVADLSLSEKGADARIYHAVAVDLMQLKSWLPELFSMEDFLQWDMKSQKLLAEQRQCLGKLILSKQTLNNVTETQKQTAILAGIRQAGLTVLPWDERSLALLTRLRCAHNWLADCGFIDYSETALLADLEEWLLPYLTGVTGPAQMKKIPLSQALLSRLEWSLQQTLETALPTHFTVPTGSKIKLRYSETTSPALPVRIQEMFGQANKPTVAHGKVPIVIELLSPAMRPIQITQDLLGFWRGSYAEVKKEMKGRYPKHYWPDDPLEAMPTRRVKKHM